MLSPFAVSPRVLAGEFSVKEPWRLRVLGIWTRSLILDEAAVSGVAGVCGDGAIFIHCS